MGDGQLFEGKKHQSVRDDVNDDREHLRLLTIFHYVLAGFLALTGCFPFIHLAVGFAILAGHFPEQPNQQFSNETAGYLFVGIAITAIVFSWSLAVCLLCAARFLQQRRHYFFCLIVAGVECLLMPFGTMLGVFTIVVLNRPSVKELFNVGVASIANPLSTT
jgi:hypothetical protein